MNWFFSWFAPSVQIDLIVDDFQQASDRLKHVIEGVMVGKEVQYALIDNAHVEIKELEVAEKRANKIKSNIDKIIK